MRNLRSTLECEILAPAGSFECMQAAYHAGADAVYAGGERFGARQTVNFEKEELIEAINYSHIRGKRFYLTVNTLLKEEELEKELFDYLLPAYQAGLDAAIVQDMGVLLFIRRYFPELPVHVSTQMNVTGSFMAKELKSLGVTRIVTARELSLEEISDIYKATGLEIESFVHGALCYSYSGQCLLSSMIGGRSGNRGCCAQPCRLAYDVMTEERCLNQQTCKFVLSPRDLCALELIPDILEAGVFSLKIEGRMKKPEYVASVTAIYRKYVDLYQTGGRETYIVNKQDIELLKEIYNRGGFTQGYYKQHNNREMMSLQQPNHCGTVVGRISSFNTKILGISIESPLNKGDVLSFDFDKNKGYYCDYTLGRNVEKGELLHIENKFQNGFSLKKHMVYSKDVFRIRNNLLIHEIMKNCMSDIKCPITGQAEFKEGMACLTVCCQNIKAVARTSAVSRARNCPLSVEDIKERLAKTGETEFFFQELEIVSDDNLFISIKELNQLRREAIELLRQKVLNCYKRKLSDCDRKEENILKEQPYKRPVKAVVSVLVSTYEQFLCAVSSGVVQQIYIEASLFSYEEMSKMAEAAYNNDKRIFCALPYVFRKEAAKEFEEHLSFYNSSCISGFVLRNLEEYFYIRSLDKHFFNKDFIFDNFIYCYNRRTCSYLESLQPACISYPRELNYNELKALELKNGELDIYGYMPVMLTANCIRKTFDRCDKRAAADKYYLKDRKDDILRIINVCRFCYNVIYHPLPLSLLGDFQKVRRLKPASFRLDFTFESKEEMAKILQIFTCNRECDSGEYKDIEVFTRGHFRKGVQ